MLELYFPRIEELRFRRKMLEDVDTMSYNHAYGGTIDFPETAWPDWYDRWVLHPERRFYRYLRDAGSGEFVGEVAYYFDGEKHKVSLIVCAPYRNRGYGTEGLRLLCDAARENGIDMLFDDIAADNLKAVRLFLSSGFTEEYRTDELIMVKKDLHSRIEET